MAKIYNEIVIDMNPESPDFEKVLHEDSFEYNGDMALLDRRKANPYTRVVTSDHDPGHPSKPYAVGGNMNWDTDHRDTQEWFEDSDKFKGKTKNQIWQMYLQSDVYKAGDTTGTRPVSKEEVFNNILTGSAYGDHMKGIHDQDDGAVRYDGWEKGAKQYKFDKATESWTETGNTREEEVPEKSRIGAGAIISGDALRHYKPEEKLDEEGNPIVDPNEGKLMTVPSPGGKGAPAVWQYRNGQWVDTKVPAKDTRTDFYINSVTGEKMYRGEPKYETIGEEAPKGLDTAKMNAAAQFASGEEERTDDNQYSDEFNRSPIDLGNPDFMNASDDPSDPNQANQTENVNDDGSAAPEDEELGGLPPEDRGESWGAASYGVDDFYDSKTGKQYDTMQVLRNLQDKGVLKKGLDSDAEGKIRRQLEEFGPQLSNFGASPEEKAFAKDALKEDLYGIQQQAAKAAAPAARNVYGGSGASMRQKMQQEKSIAREFSQAQQKHRRTMYDLEKQGKDEYESELASFVDTNLSTWIPGGRDGGYIWKDGSGIGRNRKVKDKSSETFLDALTKIPDAGGI